MIVKRFSGVPVTEIKTFPEEKCTVLFARLSTMSGSRLVDDVGKPYKAHDNAHGAFMTLPPYTGTREGEVHSLGSGPKPCRLGLGQNTNSPFVTTTPAAGPPVFLDHFAALEQPEALVHEIRAFFKPLRQ